MTTTATTWMLCEIAGESYALDIAYVAELVSMRETQVTRLPNTPPCVDGVINLRGRSIGVLDVRTLLGMPSIREETDDILQMLREREEDHVDWIEELSASVRESREFKLATNPHLCKFGKWYDALRADRKAMGRFTASHLSLLDLVESFDVPHKRIHGIAEKVASLVSAGRTEEALTLINATRDTDLHAMVTLFDKSRKLITSVRRGVMVVLERDGARIGLLFDNALEVSEFHGADHQRLEFLEGQHPLVHEVILDGESGEIYRVIDISAIADQYLSTLSPQA
ncbi:MAG: chemotaxis protein CheW [Planctomycetales bacterium]|nr:chemotaxis protein CheW [Planctomycetales bacterium]